MGSRTEAPQNSTEHGDRQRRLILRALLDHGGRANTSQIRAHTGISNELVGYHCGKLEDGRTPPLVEGDGKEQIEGAPLAANVYRLTERGEDVAEAITDDELSVDEAQSFAELRSTIAEQQAEIAELRETVDDLATAHDGLVKKLIESDVEVQ